MRSFNAPLASVRLWRRQRVANVSIYVSPGDRARLEAIVADRNGAVTLNAMLLAGYEVCDHMRQPVPA